MNIGHTIRACTVVIVMTIAIIRIASRPFRTCRPRQAGTHLRCRSPQRSRGRMDTRGCPPFPRCRVKLSWRVSVARGPQKAIRVREGKVILTSYAFGPRNSFLRYPLVRLLEENNRVAVSALICMCTIPITLVCFRENGATRDS